MLGKTTLARGLINKIKAGKALLDMNKGIPNGRFLAGAYWRRRSGLPSGFPEHADPAADNCGLLWLSPIVPMRGEDVLRVYSTIEPIFEQYQFDLFITFRHMVNERALGAVITIAFDKEEVAETERAQACYGHCSTLLWKPVIFLIALVSNPWRTLTKVQTTFGVLLEP